MLIESLIINGLIVGMQTAIAVMDFIGRRYSVGVTELDDLLLLLSSPER